MSEISDILNALKFGQVHQLDIELTPEQSADLLTHIDDLHFAVNEQPELTARIAELEADKERLNSCESALISMVNQFFYSKAGENIFRHSFMSAEEEAATYLVEHGIACWTDDYKSAIRFIGA